MDGGPDLLHLLGDRVDLIHAPSDGAVEIALSGRDYDCIVSGLDPYWPLRLRDHAVVQQLHYDMPSWYWVCRIDRDLVAVDALEDPRGRGRYGFPTADALRLGGSDEAGVVAAYLAAKRVRKKMQSHTEWQHIAHLSLKNPAVFTQLMQRVFGRRHGEALAAEVLQEGTPSAAMLKRARRAQTMARMKSPSDLLAIAVGGAARVFERTTAPTGLRVEIAGPDGTGKSTLAAALVEATGGMFRRTRRAHWRPSILGRASSATLSRRDPTDPHGRQPRGRLASLPFVVYHWADFGLGSVVVYLPHKIRSGLWVQERGWWDLSVDPRRYRLQVPSALVRGLGRLLPQPELLLVLVAEADDLAARQNEISAEEVNRQSQMWRALTLSTRTEKVVIDATKPREEVLDEAADAVAAVLERRTLRRLGKGWAGLPARGHARWIVPRGPRPVVLASLSVHQPMTRSGRWAWSSGRFIATIGGIAALPRTNLPGEVLGPIAPYLPSHSIPAFARSNHPGRWVVLVLDRSGARICLLKVATEEHGRSALRAERDALTRWADRLPAPVRAPALLEWSKDVLVLEAVTPKSRAQPSMLDKEVAAALGFFHRGNEGAAGVAHGDFAPWNLLQNAVGGWTLVDWEHAAEDRPAFYDLWHWLVQSHVLLKTLSAEDLLTAPRSRHSWVRNAFSAYAQAAAVDLDQAMPSLRLYLTLSKSHIKPGAYGSAAALRARESLTRALGT